MAEFLIKLKSFRDAAEGEKVTKVESREIKEASKVQND